MTTVGIKGLNVNVGDIHQTNEYRHSSLKAPFAPCGAKVNNGNQSHHPTSIRQTVPHSWEKTGKPDWKARTRRGRLSSLGSRWPLNVQWMRGTGLPTAWHDRTNISPDRTCVNASGSMTMYGISPTTSNWHNISPLMTSRHKHPSVHNRNQVFQESNTVRIGQLQYSFISTPFSLHGLTHNL